MLKFIKIAVQMDNIYDNIDTHMAAMQIGGEGPEPEINTSEDDEPNIFGCKKSYGKVATAAAVATETDDQDVEADNQDAEDEDAEADNQDAEDAEADCKGAKPWHERVTDVMAQGSDSRSEQCI